MFTLLAFPQAGTGSIAQLAHALRTAHMLLVVLHVGETSHGGHANAIEGKFPLGGQLDYNFVIELAQYGAKGAGGVYEMAGLSGILLQAMDARAHGQGAQWIGVTLVGSH